MFVSKFLLLSSEIPPQELLLEYLDSPLPIGKQSPCFTSLEQDRHYKGIVQIALYSNPDVMAVPDPIQSRH